MGRGKGSKITPRETAPAVVPERTAELSGIIKQSMLETFEQIGGVKGMKIWARKNRGAFYKLFAQLAPQLDRHAKGSGVVVQVAQFGTKGVPNTPPTEQQLSLIDITAVDGPTAQETPDPDGSAAE